MYFRVSPWVKARLTKRGVRLGLGPRIARLHLGAGGKGISTGFGPFSAYRALGRRSRALSRKSGIRG